MKGRSNHDTSTGQRIGEVLPVTWVPIADPDPAEAATDSQAVFRQGWEQGAARFNRLEGAWYGDGSVFFISTNGGDPRPGGDPGLGQVWQYLPAATAAASWCCSSSPVTPRSWRRPTTSASAPAVGCWPVRTVTGPSTCGRITRDGRVFDFATHTLDGSNELAGANWSPDGNWLFVNVQDPGVTYAVTGPWEAGEL